jgi:hypothetical protein
MAPGPGEAVTSVKDLHCVPEVARAISIEASCFYGCL